MATRVVTTPLKAKSPLRERTYLAEVLRGMGITITHFLKNLADLRRDRVGMTYQWPEQPTPLPPTLRGEHRLMQRPDGTPRCVACNCCATACPAYCIEITGADTGHDGVEKYPVAFDIDILQCVYCGLCVEACPCDAIRMDTGKITAAYFEGPVKILNIDYLLHNHPEGKSPVSDAIY
ncbi:MAG TPA: NADH-quinone oxidoreductase subunit I [Candidatus Krumholzibacteria bacterium]|nr:NADH-quinone oxidoreductase subunit I [Candidatus Krumholzibacteria bacterium]